MTPMKSKDRLHRFPLTQTGKDMTPKELSNNSFKSIGPDERITLKGLLSKLIFWMQSNTV